MVWVPSVLTGKGNLLNMKKMLTEGLPMSCDCRAAFVFSSRYEFQKYGATYQIYFSSTPVFQQKCGRLHTPCLPQSPNLNIIEHVCKILKKKLEEKAPKNVSELCFNYCQEARHEFRYFGLRRKYKILTHRT